MAATATAFDSSAHGYDAWFTHSLSGQMQRQQVLAHLQVVLGSQPKRVLELNCGTGHDAIWMAEHGHSVLATDISADMLEVARSKGYSGAGALRFAPLDISDLHMPKNEPPFDLIFSNFGGINCLNINNLEQFLTRAHGLLVPGGRMVLVIMSRGCLWEINYYLLKGKPKTAFRRRATEGLSVPLQGGDSIQTWYYSPGDVRALAGGKFKVRAVKPIGFFVPPSYLEPFLQRHKSFAKMLGRLDKAVASWSILANGSDHFLIDIEKV